MISLETHFHFNLVTKYYCIAGFNGFVTTWILHKIVFSTRASFAEHGVYLKKKSFLFLSDDSLNPHCHCNDIKECHKLQYEGYYFCSSFVNQEKSPHDDLEYNDCTYDND